MELIVVVAGSSDAGGLIRLNRKGLREAITLPIVWEDSGTQRRAGSLPGGRNHSLTLSSGFWRISDNTMWSTGLLLTHCAQISLCPHRTPIAEKEEKAPWAFLPCWNHGECLFQSDVFLAEVRWCVISSLNLSRFTVLTLITRVRLTIPGRVCLWPCVVFVCFNGWFECWCKENTLNCNLCDKTSWKL